MARRRRIALFTPVGDTPAAGTPAAGSDTKVAGRKTRTSPAVIALACVAGALGAHRFGLHAMACASLAQFGTAAVIAAGILRGLVGIALGVSLVGLCGLIGGAKLGRRFSYPFSLVLVDVAIRFASDLLDPLRPGIYGEFAWVIWSTEIILAAIVGTVLVKCIAGYIEQSGAWAAIGAISAVLIGWLFVYLQSGGQPFGWSAVVEAILFALYGGALGAIAGAIRARRQLKV